jgi:hypothetical protein
MLVVLCEMEGSRHKDWTEKTKMDRDIIRIDLPQSHAGITAALRRAFEAAAAEPSERDFAALLARLN